MTEEDFAFFRALLRRRSGLALGADQAYLLEARLAPLCRGAGLPSLSALVAHLRLRPDPALEASVVEAMTTNETLFFRDRTAFDALRDDILPALLAARAERRHLRIWCAAASTGQEPYSVAMLLADMQSALAGWRVEILATDISAEAIFRARAGVYSQFEVQRGLPIRRLLRDFTQSGAGWTIAPELRRAVEFRVFNLLDGFEPLGRFDLILCRNLVIYLDGASRATLLGKLSAALAPDGVLCLGASEVSVGLSPPFIPHPERRGFFLRRAVPATKAAAGRHAAWDQSAFGSAV